MSTTTTRPTHTLRAHNMRIGHVRGVQPVGVSLVGTHELTDEDRETLEAIILDLVRRVVPLVKSPRVRWNPSGSQAVVNADLSGPMAKPGRSLVIATFRVGIL